MSTSHTTKHQCEVPNLIAGRAALVDGFQSPFGLELLSTVHWVMRHEAVQTPDDVDSHTYAWNERKRQFTRRQIRIAAGVLASKGWVEPLAAEAET